ncbi:MAG TPA: exosortase/archaeosortase family protein [Vicinamibacterales bacterium]|nr:exosortase/archaeosortase family protein [Vicinamibacterales bacterium]
MRRALMGRCVVLLLPAGAFLWLYGDVLAGLARQWANDSDYSHGFLVVPLAAFFAWERRQELARADVRPAASGIFAIAVSLLVFLIGTYGADLFLARVSIVGVVAGIVWFLCGSKCLRILAFPLAFLTLMVPLPEILFNQITFPLQLIASRAGELVISAAGVPVLREGNILQLPGRTLEVAEACSGIRSLMSLLMLAIVLGKYSEARPARRLAIAAAAVPIAIAANALRVAGTGLASAWISPAAADGFFHSFSGWVAFVVAAGALVALHRSLAWLLRMRFRAAAVQA